MSILGTILGWIIAIYFSFVILGFLITGLSWCLPDFKNLFRKVPDEFTIEIVKENPDKASVSQNEPSVQPSKAKSHASPQQEDK